jgi:hypothetical protein
VLFGDVELQRGDNPEWLAGLGMGLFYKGRKRCFNQPCTCFDGQWCRIYDQRPKRCRTFECRLLKQAHAGEVSVSAALKSIAEAHAHVNEVQKLVRDLGHSDESVPLNRRYAAVLAEPIDLAAEDHRGERRSDLMLAVDELVKILGRDFLGGG